MEHEPRKAGTRPLALTLGEPAGIGPDITLLAWLRRNELKLPPFYLLGDSGLLERRAGALGLTIKLADVIAEGAGAVFADALPVVATGQIATITLVDSVGALVDSYTVAVSGNGTGA